MAIPDIRDLAEFNKALADAGNKLVLVDFHALWCGPCKMIAPTVKELANTHADKLVVLKVDVDEAADVAEQAEISAMPTFIFYKNGKQVATFKGANKEKLTEMTLENL
uniref:Thioredoxin n=1 Tax=Ciona intestinalis TaxID=7719 RepID=A0A1W2WN02_CIOIN|nr:thioredoxin-2 [Ciona intestinalis]|eukprot:XP_002132022.1 thioredoxin-2 [Ciona intestinalis]